MSHATIGVLLLTAAGLLAYAWLHGLGASLTSAALGAASGTPKPPGKLPKFP